MLREYDTIFLIDDSTSMKGERWHQAQAAIMGVVEQAVMYDDDGIDVFFLNSKRVGKGLGSRDDVEELFAGLEPKGATPTGLRIESILRDYMSRLERATADGETVRSMNLIVVTDGGKSLLTLPPTATHYTVR
jgi:Mg-chelatase subunit ChlD